MQVELFSHGEESHSFASVSHLQENNRGKLVTVSTFIAVVAVTAETCSGWPHSSQDKIACVFPVLDNFSLCYFYVINNS